MSSAQYPDGVTRKRFRSTRLGLQWLLLPVVSLWLVALGVVLQSVFAQAISDCTHRARTEMILCGPAGLPDAGLLDLPDLDASEAVTSVLVASIGAGLAITCAAVGFRRMKDVWVGEEPDA